MLRLAAVLIAGAAAWPAVAAAQPTPAPPLVVDGPSAAITQLGGLAIARDGTGGLVYLKGGRVVVSALVGGRFQAPHTVDARFASASSQPVIAAGNGGVVLIAFINGGALYVVQRSSTTAAFSAPAALAGAAANPSLDMNNLGKAYLAFTVSDGGGHDVRAAYYVGGSWALESAPLNAAPADDAGTGTGAPRVVASGDGVAIVAWGEGGHVVSRRVWGTAPSVVDEQADVPSLSGCGEVSTANPDVSSGGDSSYADVAFQETLSCGGVQQTRVLMNRLHGSRYDGIQAVDGLSSPGTQSAGEPHVALTEYGQGLITSVQQSSHNLFAMQPVNNGGSGPVTQVNGAAGASDPHAVPGIAGLYSALVAWQQTPGASGPADLRVRYYQTRTDSFGPETVLSSPSLGAVDAALGIFAGGDVGGDAAAAWVQGSGASTRIVVAQLYQSPGAVGVPTKLAYSRTAQPALSWSPAGGRWGPITYTVRLDRAQVGQTGATSLRVPAALHDGAHSWQVVASNPAGLRQASRVARVFVDTVAPALAARVSGARRAGTALSLRLTYRDAPRRGLPARDASGVAKLTVRWGDGTVTHPKRGVHRSSHVYRRARRYRITVTVVDRAGNTRTVVRRVKVQRSAPTRKPASKH